jgi:integrase
VGCAGRTSTGRRVAFARQLTKPGPDPTFGPPKNGFPRDITLSAETIDLLRQHKRALQAGEPVHVVSKRLGHARVQTTLDTYAHVLPDMQRQAAATLGSLLHAVSKPCARLLQSTDFLKESVNGVDDGVRPAWV